MSALVVRVALLLVLSLPLHPASLQSAPETVPPPLHPDPRRLLYELQHERSALLLDAPSDVERFLQGLEGRPPAWEPILAASDPHAALFELNRERDARREGRSSSSRLICFLWEGVLSDYDPQQGAFRVAVGPKVVPTSWGLVRFKPESLPSALETVPAAGQRDALRARVAGGETVEVIVAFTGRLAAEESIIYDLAHEEPRAGMILPVVWVERVDYALRGED